MSIRSTARAKGTLSNRTGAFSLFPPVLPSPRFFGTFFNADGFFSWYSQAYVEFTSQQAATAMKHHIDSLEKHVANQKKPTVAYTNPNVNPFRTLPKDTSNRQGKDGQVNRTGPGFGSDRGPNMVGDFRQANFRGRGGYGPRGGMQPGGGFNRNFSGGMGGGGGFNNMGAGFGGGAMGGGGFGGGFNNRGGFAAGGMRGGPGAMRGGRGGMGNMGGMGMGGPMGPMGPMGGMPMGGMPNPMGMMGGNMQGMWTVLASPSYVSA